MSHIIHPLLSNKVMGAAIAVHKALGPGLLHRAMEESHRFCREAIMSFEVC